MIKHLGLKIQSQIILQNTHQQGKIKRHGVSYNPVFYFKEQTLLQI